MAAINDLISQILDKELRERLQQEVDRMNKQKKFGLVFEEHLPECTPLYDIPIRKGSLVAQKAGEVQDDYIIESLHDGTAICKNKITNEEKEFAVDELVSVAQFGETIYPYLEPIDSVCNAPDSDLWHTLIEADNYHALQLLEYLYAGKVDCIYIDPPYNTGARDWKYNNDYVDSSDTYRHSKWLSMIQKRLKIAKKLLNPKNSVLIVTIDEKEYLHLGCLLEEMFPEAKMQMISSVINASGVARGNEFYRTDEYIFILRFGECVPAKIRLSNDWLTANTTGKDNLRWRRIRRQGSHDTRRDAPNQFFPIYLSSDGKKYIGAGDSLPANASKESVVLPQNCVSIWPLKPDGTEGCWQISQQSLDELYKEGFIKITWTKKWGYTPQYLAKGERAKVNAGQFPVLGRDEYGSVITDEATEEAPFVPGTQWRIPSHNAREHGAKILRKIFLDKRFDFPKSLYAVSDVIRFFVAEKPNSLVVDFFAGSGTTLHAVNLLNAEDGGHRRCILVTNNEVSDNESKILTAQGHHPGDAEWEKLGIARYVTWPRTVCSIKGRDVNGEPLKGNYLGSDIPMADGFKTNAAYFKLGFLDKTSVALGKQFSEMFPTLWLKAGAHGPCLKSERSLPSMVILPDNRFAVLLDETAYPEFEVALSKHPEIETIYIVTDSEAGYREMIKGFEDKTTYQLYRDYLDNFRINIGR